MRYKEGYESKLERRWRLTRKRGEVRSEKNIKQRMREKEDLVQCAIKKREEADKSRDRGCEEEGGRC